MVWHSSITIRSNLSVCPNRCKNVWNRSRMAASGVTKTIDLSSIDLFPSHSPTDTPALSLRPLMSWRNVTNGTTTTVTPPTPTDAGNMNNMLLPPPVGITTTILPSPLWMADNASPCALRNHTSSPIIHFISPATSMCRTRCSRSMRDRLLCAWNGSPLRLIPRCTSSLMLELNPKNRCQSTLAVRNCCRRLAIDPGNSCISRA